MGRLQEKRTEQQLENSYEKQQNSEKRFAVRVWQLSERELRLAKDKVLGASY